MTDWFQKKTFGSLAQTLADRFGEREALIIEDEHLDKIVETVRTALRAQ